MTLRIVCGTLAAIGLTTVMHACVVFYRFIAGDDGDCP